MSKESEAPEQSVPSDTGRGHYWFYRFAPGATVPYAMGINVFGENLDDAIAKAVEINERDAREAGRDVPKGEFIRLQKFEPYVSQPEQSVPSDIQADLAERIVGEHHQQHHVTDMSLVQVPSDIQALQEDVAYLFGCASAWTPTVVDAKDRIKEALTAYAKRDAEQKKQIEGLIANVKILAGIIKSDRGK